jgi:uncharacterized protein YndB with AHSA1/START domain
VIEPTGKKPTMALAQIIAEPAVPQILVTERDEVTLLTQRTVFQSAADRDAALESNMADGINESMERLGELLARLAPVR